MSRSRDSQSKAEVLHQMRRQEAYLDGLNDRLKAETINSQAARNRELAQVERTYGQALELHVAGKLSKADFDTAKDKYENAVLRLTPENPVEALQAQVAANLAELQQAYSDYIADDENAMGLAKLKANQSIEQSDRKLNKQIDNIGDERVKTAMIALADDSKDKGFAKVDERVDLAAKVRVVDQAIKRTIDATVRLENDVEKSRPGNPLLSIAEKVSHMERISHQISVAKENIVQAQQVRRKLPKLQREALREAAKSAEEGVASLEKDWEVVKFDLNKQVNVEAEAEARQQLGHAAGNIDEVKRLLDTSTDKAELGKCIDNIAQCLESGADALERARLQAESVTDAGVRGSLLADIERADKNLEVTAERAHAARFSLYESSDVSEEANEHRDDDVMASSEEASDLGTNQPLTPDDVDAPSVVMGDRQQPTVDPSPSSSTPVSSWKSQMATDLRAYADGLETRRGGLRTKGAHKQEAARTLASALEGDKSAIAALNENPRHRDMLSQKKGNGQAGNLYKVVKHSLRQHQGNDGVPEVSRNPVQTITDLAHQVNVDADQPHAWRAGVVSAALDKQVSRDRPSGARSAWDRMLRGRGHKLGKVEAASWLREHADQQSSDPDTYVGPYTVKKGVEPNDDDSYDDDELTRVERELTGAEKQAHIDELAGKGKTFGQIMEQVPSSVQANIGEPNKKNTMKNLVDHLKTVKTKVSEKISQQVSTTASRYSSPSTLLRQRSTSVQERQQQGRPSPFGDTSTPN